MRMCGVEGVRGGRTKQGGEEGFKSDDEGDCLAVLLHKTTG